MGDYMLQGSRFCAVRALASSRFRAAVALCAARGAFGILKLRAPITGLRLARRAYLLRPTTEDGCQPGECQPG